MADAAKALPQFFEAMKNAPTAPVVMRAIGRFVADLVIAEAKKVGPTPAWLSNMVGSGWSEAEARAFYSGTMQDAIGRVILTEPEGL